MESPFWPCVEIRPSDFLKRGLDNIYIAADETFDNLIYSGFQDRPFSPPWVQRQFEDAWKNADFQLRLEDF